MSNYTFLFCFFSFFLQIESRKNVIRHHFHQERFLRSIKYTIIVYTIVFLKNIRLKHNFELKLFWLIEKCWFYFEKKKMHANIATFHLEINHNVGSISRSFGVLLWEIMSFGYTPYIGLGNQDVIKMVKTGGRLGKPVGCPDPIYGIMMKCWRARPERRPNFSNIVERIGYCLQVSIIETRNIASHGIIFIPTERGKNWRYLFFYFAKDPDVVCGPTPKYDVLPTDEGEITMWPDPEAECINMQSDVSTAPK